MEKKTDSTLYMGASYVDPSDTVDSTNKKAIKKLECPPPDAYSNRIPNVCPPDNNVYWEGAHNPLRSKGD